jgi:hypothetical protein
MTPSSDTNVKTANFLIVRYYLGSLAELTTGAVRPGFYSPRHTGGRLARNASTPSLKSRLM